MNKTWNIALSLFFLLMTVSVVAAGEEPEEPDYAFLAGGPYTQVRNSMQLILANTLSRQKAIGTAEWDLANSLRMEWGFTDRVEADLILSLQDQWAGASQHGFNDTVLGVRYRFLKEDFSPVTLAFGPQLVFPTGDVGKGFGTGGVGIAWDLTLAREWNRWFFHYASINYTTTAGASDPTTGSNANFTLHNLNWGVALALRPLERDSSCGGHHDLHLFLEAVGTLGQAVDAGAIVGNRATTSTYRIAPGLRYGYITKDKTLTEIGFSVPVGLNNNTPDWGIILQTQWENLF